MSETRDDSCGQVARTRTVNIRARVRARMYGERKQSVIILVSMLLLASMAAVLCVAADDSDATAEPNYVTGDSIDLQANGSKTYRVDITNDDPSEVLYVSMTASVTTVSGDKVDTIDTKVTAYLFDPDTMSHLDMGVPVVVGGDKIAIFSITISADKFAAHGNYVLKLTWTAKDYTGVTVKDSGSKDVDITLNSSLSTSDNYNKFLGFIDNNFDGFLGSVWFTVAVSIVAWIVIGLVIMSIAVPVVVFLMTRKDDPDRPILRRSLVRQCLIIIVVFTAVNILCIFGIDEKLTDTVKSLAHLVYLIVGLGIAWRIYKTFLDRMSDHMRGRDMIAGGDMQEFESFKPLFIYIGEIIITLIGLFVGLGMLGINLTAIITAAGVVTLGITFGAQQVLSQFFSGLVILATRPFKKGDLIQIGTGTIVYRVRKVNVMNTELENWDNSDITILPNNTITSSAVKNITRDTLRTKVHIFISCAYDTDLSKARAAMLEVANANPRVIKDGSVSRPSTRVVDFEDSNISLRLTVWVDDYNDHGAIGGELRQALFNKFNELGINIDYTQIVLRPFKPAADDTPDKE